MSMLEFSGVGGLRAVSCVLFASILFYDCGGGNVWPMSAPCLPRKSGKQDLCCLPVVVLIKTAGSFHFWLQFRPVWPSPLTKRLFWAENLFAICPKNPGGTDARTHSRWFHAGAYWLLLESLVPVPVDFDAFFKLLVPWYNV